ncbi:MAG: alpha-1,2-fucosyltransferase [Bacteroidetes bacterium]|nr:alpha-1,2-fucosyltransferase [Bacteroidota bacterium]
MGNKLFPWSRAIVIADKLEYDLIDPVWFSPRGAGITRGGINYAKSLGKIWLLKNFKNREKDVSYFKNFDLFHSKFSLVGNLDEAFKVMQLEGNVNLMFGWNTCHNFEDLYDYRSLIFTNLNKITRNRSLARIEKFRKNEFIGLNIRTGKDFIKKGSEKRGYYLTEIDWFVKALNISRELYGKLPALVISDGGEKELEKILKLPDVSLLHSSNAIEDLLVLTKSKVLLGSGNSSFSAWASFLGGMNTYSSVETPFDHFKIVGNSSKQIVNTL